MRQLDVRWAVIFALLGNEVSWRNVDDCDLNAMLRLGVPHVWDIAREIRGRHADHHPQCIKRWRGRKDAILHPGRLTSVLGSRSSPLFVSTNFLEMCDLPVLVKASTLGRLCHTPLVSKYLSSSALAARTIAGMSGYPVTAST